MNQLACVFDFTGVLFWDTHFHDNAWPTGCATRLWKCEVLICPRVAQRDGTQQEMSLRALNDPAKLRQLKVYLVAQPIRFTREDVKYSFQ